MLPQPRACAGIQSGVGGDLDQRLRNFGERYYREPAWTPASERCFAEHCALLRAPDDFGDDDWSAQVRLHVDCAALVAGQAEIRSATIGRTPVGEYWKVVFYREYPS